MTDKLRAAAQQVLEASETLKIALRVGMPEYGAEARRLLDKAITALRTALENQFNPDWDRIEALRESLREHMAEIQRLRQALEFTAQHKSSDWPERCQQMVDTARAALMSVPDGAEQSAKHGEPVAWISGGGICELQETGRTEVFAEKDYECLETAPLYTAPRPANPAEQEPVATLYGTLPIYETAPQPTKQPLTDDEIDALELPPSGTATVRDLVRLIERAHGIGEQE